MFLAVTLVTYFRKLVSIPGPGVHVLFWCRAMAGPHGGVQGRLPARHMLWGEGWAGSEGGEG